MSIIKNIRDFFKQMFDPCATPSLDEIFVARIKS